MMTEKTPDFVKRVKEKFMPRIKTMWKRRDYNRPYCMLLGINNAEKMIPMGGEILREDDRGSPVIRFKGIDGEYVDWIALYDSPQPRLHGDLYLTSGSDKEGRSYQGHYACGKGGNILVCVPSSREEEEIEKKVVKLIGLNEWQNCHDFYAKKYQTEKREFEAKNPIWKKIMDLDSEDMKASMSEKELKAMRKLYEAQLKKDPNYQSLQSLKQDVFDLDTYVKYFKKQEKSEERKGLKGCLESLKKEYDSSEVKEALPDEKTRLTVRGIMHKKLKKEAGV